MTAIPLTLADVAYDIQINQLPNWIRAVEDMTMRTGFLYPRLSQQGGILREPGAYEDIWKLKVPMSPRAPAASCSSRGRAASSTFISMPRAPAPAPSRRMSMRGRPTAAMPK